MSATADGPERSGEAAASGDDHAYFRAVEEVFLRLRGAPLLLSPADFRVAAEWHGRGIPLAVVAGALEELFADRRERGASGRVSSLRYCKPAVEAAWREHREVTATGSRAPAAAPLAVAPRLAALAAALPEALPGRTALAGEIGALAALGDDSRAIEERLAELDRRAGEALLAALPAAERRALDAEVEATVAAVAARLPRAEAEAARERLRGQHLRRRAGLPTLSLFAPEAEPRGEEG